MEEAQAEELQWLHQSREGTKTGDMLKLTGSETAGTDDRTLHWESSGTNPDKAFPEFESPDESSNCDLDIIGLIKNKQPLSHGTGPKEIPVGLPLRGRKQQLLPGLHTAPVARATHKASQL
ncbi:hypothetical protein STEG23_036367 [Scotinomys teguina]